MSPQFQPSRAGFTLIELIAVLAILGIVLGAIVSQFLSFQRALVENEVVSNSEVLLRRALDRIVEEVRKADLDTLTVDPSRMAITFSPIQGWDGEAFTVGNPMRITLTQYGDLTINGSVVASGLKRLGLEQSGRTLAVTLSVERSAGVGEAQHTVERELTTKVML